MTDNNASRRSFLVASGAATLAAALPRTVWASTDAAAMPKGKAEHCIYIWLGGGASQIDTFDPKKRGDSKTRKAGSDYAAIDTAIPGVQVCEHLKHCAPILDRFNLIRTVHHDVIDEHAAAVNRMHTGRPTSGTIVYPSLGSIVAHMRGAADEGAPAYVVCGYPNITRGPGFLGSSAGYIYLTDTKAGPAGLKRPDWIGDARQSRREGLLSTVRGEYLEANPGDTRIANYDTTIGQAQALGGPKFMSVFDLDRESPDLRNAYGGEFGQRCLLARRLLEAGTRFVEVSHNLNFVNGTGWDTHNEGQQKQHLLIQELDQAMATLVLDLERRNMLDKTLIVVAGEFGRPGGFDGGGGRGHHSKSFSVVFAGGGLKTGSAIGTTNELAEEIVDRPVSVPDLFATVHACLGINPHEELYAGERPVPITDQGTPIAELFS
jgi:hypothetical protein